MSTIIHVSFDTDTARAYMEDGKIRIQFKGDDPQHLANTVIQMKSLESFTEFAVSVSHVLDLAGENGVELPGKAKGFPGETFTAKEIRDKAMLSAATAMRDALLSVHADGKVEEEIYHEVQDALVLAGEL